MLHVGEEYEAQFKGHPGTKPFGAVYNPSKPEQLSEATRALIEQEIE